MRDEIEDLIAAIIFGAILLCLVVARYYLTMFLEISPSFFGATNKALTIDEKWKIWWFFSIIGLLIEILWNLRESKIFIISTIIQLRTPFLVIASMNMVVFYTFIIINKAPYIFGVLNNLPLQQWGWRGFLLFPTIFIAWYILVIPHLKTIFNRFKSSNTED